MIKHSPEITTLYGHIREGGIKVSVGQKVDKGQKIAEVGSTGRSTGNHLHFTVYKNEVAVDPMPYLASAFRRRSGKYCLTDLHTLAAYLFHRGAQRMVS